MLAPPDVTGPESPLPGAGGNPPPSNPDPAGGADPSRQPAGGQPPAAPGWQRPEGLPDHLAGTDAAETAEKLFKAFDGYRRAEAERGTVPKDATGYQLQVDDKLKPYVEGFDKDPIFAATRDIMLKAGVTDKQFNAILGPLFGAMIDGGLVDAPIDANAELLKLTPADMEGASEAERKAAAGKRLQDNIAWVDSMAETKAMPPAVAEFLNAAAADKVAGNLLVEWLRGQDREQQPALGGRSSGASEGDVKARMIDPRNDPNSPQFSRAFADETDRLSRQTWG